MHMRDQFNTECLIQKFMSRKTYEHKIILKCYFYITRTYFLVILFKFKNYIIYFMYNFFFLLL